MAIVDAFVDPTGIASAVINPIAQVALVPVTDHVGYMISCRKYVRAMQTKMTELDTARIDVEEHISRNTRNHLEIPSQVRGLLDKVEGIKENVENFPSDVISCCSLRIRRKLGRKAFKITEQIESLTRQLALIGWINDPIPMGRVGSMNASTSSSSSDDFPSREHTFTQALKALEPNHKFHMIALCGMGGVGKTRMMQRLKKAAKEKKLFNYILEAVIGEKTDPIAIQDAIADYLGIQLNEKTKPARADKLRQGFKDNSDGGKNKFFVILDDVWESVDLEDIGLSRFPNQGVEFKVLLTSRDRHVCTMMGVKADAILNVGLLKEAEAQNMFSQFVENSDPELLQIGEDIVRKCCGLPIAIKTMACTLRTKSKDAWKDALSRLKHHDIDNVASKVFETSYDNLQAEETKSTFLLCGLFPEDFKIPTEELVRYGWGLKLFKKVYTIREARTRLNTCIERLIHTNLLIGSDDGVHVKMHDLVRAFVLGMFSEDEHASIVNHGKMPGWPAENDRTGYSCKTISLTCKGMSEFPGDLKFPNLKILKLMHGDKSLRFPQDFYEGMEKLQVISYDEMKYPLLPPSPQCSNNLRVLHLHKCSLRMFDCSCIGNLLNLEVLSFAGSGIERLPSTIGNLKKLRLLDLKRCRDLQIEHGVLKKLVKLEELYIGKASGFTDDNCNEMAERSNSLSALEFEFFNNKAQVKNMSFENLERFKISVGCSLDEDISESSHSYENTLQLVTNKGEVFDSKVNELFVKTKVLCLTMDGMNDLEDVEVKSTHPPQSSSFCNLRVLVVSRCAGLRYLFKLHVANTLFNLEHLEVFQCDNMEEIIHKGTGGSGKEIITFPKLKFLSLCRLPKLLGFSRDVNIIELPQLVDLKLKGIPSFTRIYPQNNLDTSTLLKEEVVIPKLEKLQIDDMENLKEIWPCELSRREKVKLREIEVSNCDKLVNLFPHNPMSLLHHLEELKVENCGSIESLFNIGLDCVGVIGEEDNNSGLRIIKVKNCDKLVNLFPHNPMSLLHHLEELTVANCGSIESLFNIDLDCVGVIGEEDNNSGLRIIKVKNCDKLVNLFPHNPMSLLHHLEELTVENCGSIESLFNIGLDCVGVIGEEDNNSGLRIIKVKNCDKLVNLFPHNPMSLLHHLEELTVENCDSIESLFNIDLDRAGAIGEDDNSSSLRSIKVVNSGKLREVWRIKGADNSRPLVRGFHAVESISIKKCERFRNVFTPTTTNFDIGALLKISIEDCGENQGNNESEESKQEEEQTDILSEEETLQEVTDTNISNVVFPSSLIHSFHNLRKLALVKHEGVEVVFEIESPTSRELVTTHHNQQPLLPYLEELDLHYMGNMSHVWKCSNWNKFFTLPKQQSESTFHNLTTINIENCKSIKYLFSPLMAELLSNLKDVEIRECDGIEEVVSNRDDEDEEMTTSYHTSTILFPHLDSLTLYDLNNLKCIGGGGAKDGSNEISFTNTTTTTDQFELCEAGGVSWSLCQYAREISIAGCHALSSVVPCYAAGQMQKLQVLSVESCDGMKEVFESQLGTSSNNKSGCDEGIPRLNNNVIMLPNLKILYIKYCGRLEHIFTFSALESLRQLEELEIWNCEAMKVIVKKEEEDASSSELEVVVFPRLKSIELKNIPELEGFYLGKNEIQWPSLDKVKIENCPKMMVFAPGGSTAPQLKYMHTGLGKHTLESGLNFHAETPSPSSHDAISYPATSDGMPWSFHNLIELDVKWNGDVKKIIPSSELLQLQKLEKILVKGCNEVEEVFETALEAAGRNSGRGFDESSQTTTTTTLVNLPNLREVEVRWLYGLRYIWKSNQWTVFQFPNLTRVHILVCIRLEHVFTSSMVGSLLQLQELRIYNCEHMEEVIVKEANVAVEAEEESDGKTNQILVLPCLKSLRLERLRCLKGFSLGKEDFSFPLLDTLRINDCPAITTFTKGNSATPQLKEIIINLESFYAAGEKNINSIIKIKQEESKKR